MYAALICAGFVGFFLTGRTAAFSYMSMIRLFCMTGGRSNDWISAAIGFCRRPYRFADARGILGDMTNSSARSRAVSALRESGYYLFERRLPEDVCDRLLRYSTTQPCQLSQMDGQNPALAREAVYVRGQPNAVRYNFKTSDLLRNSDVQDLLADQSLAELAQDYLGARPIIDVVTMWWLTDFSDRPDAQAAQFYHFDMDRPKWLKFFIYLTDVYAYNGPHSFVAGSHRTGAIPDRLLSKGYSRLSDEEVVGSFDAAAITEIVAPRGTILAEDTRGLHKGKHVLRGDRLMLQIQFSNSLFGARYPKVSMGDRVTPSLGDCVRRYPALYTAYR